MTVVTQMSPEMETLKTRLKTTWMSGDYGHFAQYLEEGALEILARMQVPAGARMLDVGCGAGQIAIPAARAGVQVTGIDIATNLIEQARARATKEGVSARFDDGDAEALPYDDASFDVVVSLIGSMFAPRPDLVAAEMKRVVRPGGRIVMANWTPQSHVGQMFKTIGKHVPPSPLMISPVLWGDDATLRARLADGTTSIHTETRRYPMRYPFPPAQVVQFFFEYYGPTNRAYAALDATGQAALRADLEAVWTANNTATDGTTLVMSEYLEVNAIRG